MAVICRMTSAVRISEPLALGASAGEENPSAVSVTVINVIAERRATVRHHLQLHNPVDPALCRGRGLGAREALCAE